MHPLQKCTLVFVRQVINTIQKLDVVTACRGSGLTNLPTWTPDWSRPWFPQKLSSLDDDGYQFSAAGSSKTIFRFSEDNIILYSKGIRIDEVIDLWCRLWKMEDGHWAIDSQNWLIHYLKSAQRWMSRQPHGVYDTQSAAAEAYQKSLFTDHSDFTDASWTAFVSGYTSWIASSPNPWAFVRSTAPRMQGRLTMVSKKGYVISGPDNAKVGDILCILLGCSVPVLLRPQWRHYEIFGECYTSKLMSGNSMKSLPAGADVLEEFDLR